MKKFLFLNCNLNDIFQFLLRVRRLIGKCCQNVCFERNPLHGRMKEWKNTSYHVKNSIYFHKYFSYQKIKNSIPFQITSVVSLSFLWFYVKNKIKVINSSKSFALFSSEFENNHKLFFHLIKKYIWMHMLSIHYIVSILIKSNKLS